MELLFAGLRAAILQAICQTLIHSLWQGLIAGVLAALVVTFTKTSRASLRYNLLITVLILFVLAISITAVKQFRFAQATNGTVSTVVTMDVHSSANLETGERTLIRNFETQNLLERLDTWCIQHASIIVLTWFFLFLIKCGQLMASFHYMHRIRYRNNHEVGTYWKEHLRELADKTGINNSVVFLESELIKIPAVIGHLKPVLLVPVGLLCNLPFEQVEAILLHELAHIRRRDYLVNLLQSAIETFFFFNPAIIWISTLVREEREACCDDMVISRIPEKTNYLQALVSFQELQLYPKAGTLALTGNKHYLLNRVKRMLTMENKKLNLMEKTIFILSIVSITAFGFITKETIKSPAQPNLKSNIAKPVATGRTETVAVFKPKQIAAGRKKITGLVLPKQTTDTVPKTLPHPKKELSFPNISSNSKNDGKTTESQVEATDNQGTHYSIKRVDGQITSLAVNGTLIPQDKYDDYSEVIGQIDEAQRQRMLKRKQDLEVRKADLVERQKEMIEKRKLLALDNQNNLQNKIELRKMELEQKRAEILENQKLYNQKRAEVLENQRLYNQKKLEVLQNQNLYNQRKALMMQNEKLYKPGRMNDDVTAIIADLDNQNLIKDQNDLSFNLTDKELLVNGKKQPAEIHQQFKEKYIRSTKDKFIYSKKGNSTSITINKE